MNVKLSSLYTPMDSSIVCAVEMSIISERDDMNDWKNENLYIVHKKTFTQNHACSQHQVHTVHTCKFSQAKNYRRTLIPKNTNSPYPPTHSQKCNYA